MNHYLLTVPGNHQHMHGYLMCDERQYVIRAINWMTERMEEMGILGFAPCALETPLSTGVDAVRRIASEQDEKIKQRISQATNFHFSAWLMPDDHPDDKQLMKLH